MIAAATQVDSSNAVEILLLVGGITLVPAALFTITGFTRILIVLGFIRTGLGTPTAPPNMVLTGIALFLTIFVMMPTIKAVNHDAIQPLRDEDDDEPGDDDGPVASTPGQRSNLRKMTIGEALERIRQATVRA